MNDLKPGLIVGWQGEPWQVLEAKHVHLGRGAGIVQAKIKNIKTGKVLSPTFKPADTFEELEVQKEKARFLYEHRGVLWFDRPAALISSGRASPASGGRDNPKERFSLSQESVGESTKFLKPKTEVEAIRINQEIVSVAPPIKVALKVIEAPPSLKGEAAERSTKTVKLETGAEISVPLFINEGDAILVNTQTGKYVERVEKA